MKVLSDGWTAVTRDRSLSAQFEHSVAVTNNGVEIFTLSPRGWTGRTLRRKGGAQLRDRNGGPVLRRQDRHHPVAAGEGGAYSLYAQLAAEYLRKLSPAIRRSSCRACRAPAASTPEYLANVAPKDGTALGMLLDLVGGGADAAAAHGQVRYRRSSP